MRKTLIISIALLFCAYSTKGDDPHPVLPDPGPPKPLAALFYPAVPPPDLDLETKHRLLEDVEKQDREGKLIPSAYISDTIRMKNWEEDRCFILKLERYHTVVSTEALFYKLRKKPVFQRSREQRLREARTDYDPHHGERPYELELLPQSDYEPKPKKSYELIRCCRKGCFANTYSEDIFAAMLVFKNFF